MIRSQLERLDYFILTRVFMPIAHWADYRWHINHYRLALATINFGCFCMVAGCCWNVAAFNHWIEWLTLAIPLLSTVVCADTRSALKAASAEYERDPSQVPRSAEIIYLT